MGFFASSGFASVVAPEGPRHLIVLLDGSLNRQGQMEASKYLQKLMSSDDPEIGFRLGKDYLTVAFYGFGGNHKSFASQFVHPVLIQGRKFSASRLRRLFFTNRLYRSIPPDWVLPIALQRLKPSSQFQVQETEAILVTGEQTAKPFSLSALQRVQLSSAQDTYRSFVNESPLSPATPGYSQPFSVVAVKLEPVGLDFSKIEWPAPSSVSLAWKGRELYAQVGLPSVYEGREIKLVVSSRGTAAASQEFTAETSNRLRLASDRIVESAGPATMTVEVADTVENPLLGSTRVFREVPLQVFLPAGPLAWIGKLERLLELAALLAFAVWAGLWYRREQKVGRHFGVWLPDYANPFLPSPLNGLKEEGMMSRAERGIGEVAAVVQLPNRWLKALFYRDASIRWDERLRGHGFEGTSAAMQELPQFLALEWRDRELRGGDFDLWIERGREGKRHDRMKISVRYFSISDPEHLRLPSPTAYD